MLQNAATAHSNKETPNHHDNVTFTTSRVYRPLPLRGKKIFKYLVGGVVLFLFLGCLRHIRSNEEIIHLDGKTGTFYETKKKFIGNSSQGNNRNPTTAALHTKVETTETSHKLGKIWIQDDLATDKMKQINMNQEDDKTLETSKSFDRCNFRTYMKHRLYGIHQPFSSQPPFLTSETTYVRGTWPIVLQTENNDYRKVCTDQSEWDNDHPERWPFGDGQNPSIVSMASNPYNNHISSSEKGNEGLHLPRLDYSKNIKPLVKYLRDEQNIVEKMFLGIAVFGNAKCAWNMTQTDLDRYNYSPLDMDSKPVDQSVIFVLDEEIQTIHQLTLFLEQDADWGTNKRRKVRMSKDGENNFKRSTQQFDDPRLFFHQRNVFVLYRNGPKFGYDNQVQNPIHFEIKGLGTEEETIIAYVKASETFTVCCGRNIALISEEFDIYKPKLASGNNDSSIREEKLKALVWIDPVTVKPVNSNVESLSRRLLSVDQQVEQVENFKYSHSHYRRKLGTTSNQKKSDIHGTNGYMVPLPSTKEYLGIAHFHRPEHRQKSDYALHGHHYTHAFFTIGKQSQGNGNNIASNNNEEKYVLKRISNEFMFPSQSKSALPGDPDGDIIQFASGIDLIGSDVDGKIIISYGINDCEGAVLFMDVEEVQLLLLELNDNENEVIDLMEKVDAY